MFFLSLESWAKWEQTYHSARVLGMHEANSSQLLDKLTKLVASQYPYPILWSVLALKLLCRNHSPTLLELTSLAGTATTHKKHPVGASINRRKESFPVKLTLGRKKCYYLEREHCHWATWGWIKYQISFNISLWKSHRCVCPGRTVGIYTPKHTFVYTLHMCMLKKMCTHTNSLSLVNFVLQSFSSVNCFLFRHHN